MRYRVWITGPTRASLVEVVLCATACAVNREVFVVKSEKLKEALRLITKVQNDPRLGPGQGNHLQRAKRELEAVAQAGKLDRERLFRAVETVAIVLLQTVQDSASRRPK